MSSSPSDDPQQRGDSPPAGDGHGGGQRIALAALVGTTFLGLVWMALPLRVGLALGTVMAFTAEPLHVALSKRVRHKNSLAAAVATLLGGLLMVGAAVGTIVVVARELVSGLALVERDVAAGTLPSSAWLTHMLGLLGLQRETIVARLQQELGRIANVVAHAAGLVVQISAGALLTLVVALWTMYFVLVEGATIAGHLERLLPLDPRYTRALIDEFRIVGRGAFVGTLAGAIIQGTMVAVGFAMFGVPQPITLAVLAAVSSFIPVIGVSIVWVPAAFWLLSAGHPVRAALVTCWSLIFVMALNDYVIKPRIVGRGQTFHPFLMFVALLGGISVFGVVGVIIGPIIVSLFVASTRIYERDRETESG